MRTLVVGTRRSALAMTQTLQVVETLKHAHHGLQIEVREVVTKGDRIQDKALSQVGGKGLFVSEIEELLQQGEIDFAVHSMKDVPAELAPGLVIGAVPKRVDPRDLFISVSDSTLQSLPVGAQVGTSSLRRSAQLLKAKPGISIVPLRGNIDTRLRKSADLGGIVLAAAGILRMGWWQGEQITLGENSYYVRPLAPTEVLPAVGQGALALECRADDQETLTFLQAIHDQETALCTEAERAFLATVGGSCQVPVAAYATVASVSVGEQVMTIQGLIAVPDGLEILREEMSGLADADLGVKLAKSLLAKGGADILAALAQDQAGWK